MVLKSRSCSKTGRRACQSVLLTSQKIKTWQIAATNNDQKNCHVCQSSRLQDCGQCVLDQPIRQGILHRSRRVERGGMRSSLCCLDGFSTSCWIWWLDMASTCRLFLCTGCVQHLYNKLGVCSLTLNKCMVSLSWRWWNLAVQLGWWRELVYVWMTLGTLLAKLMVCLGLCLMDHCVWKSFSVSDVEPASLTKLLT